jgi:hypothetical protein
MNTDTIESQYNEGCMSTGEALQLLMRKVLDNRQDDVALGVMCAIIMDIKNAETKIADARLAKLGIPPLV